ncbi:MAG: diguanylate cyclase, partial [Lachnospiraceae bacterium]|nr:diguanylate cyclase [Lachnospiraceae bacterium]
TAFKPETLRIFSCAARRTFWGNEEISKETEPFQSIAPTSGFYTSSEFLRTGKYVNQHNVTLVIAGMREGVPENEHDRDFEMDKDDFSGKVSMIKRLATFIEAATEDLEKANSELSRMAVTDGLTQLLNRGEIQHQISRAVKAYRKSTDKSPILSLIMLDVDNFKQVNDRYGHNVGDDVLKGLSSVLKNKLSPENTFAGRWGGEEFMILLMMKAAEAAGIAEMLRKSFSDIDFQDAGHQTVSLGVTEINSADDPDSICIRVDQALYEAKRSGKNQVIMA